MNTTTSGAEQNNDLFVGVPSESSPTTAIATTMERCGSKVTNWRSRLKKGPDNTNKNEEKQNTTATTNAVTKLSSTNSSTKETKPTASSAIETYTFGLGDNKPATTTIFKPNNQYRIHFDEFDEVLRGGDYDSHDLVTELFKTSGVPKSALRNDYYGRKKLLPGSMLDQDYNKCFFTWHDNNPKNHLLLWTCIFICPHTGELFYAGPWKLPHDRQATTECYNDNNKNNNNNDNNADTIMMSKENDNDNDTNTNNKKLNNKVENMNSTTGNNCTKTTTTTTTTTSSSSLWWFPCKKLAQHGAAAFCFDCKVYREREAVIEKERLNPPHRRRSIIAEVVKIGYEQPYLEVHGIWSIPDSDTFVPQYIKEQIIQQQTSIFKRNKEMKLMKQQQQQQPQQITTTLLRVYDGLDDDSDDSSSNGEEDHGNDDDDHDDHYDRGDDNDYDDDYIILDPSEQQQHEEEYLPPPESSSNLNSWMQ